MFGASAPIASLLAFAYVLCLGSAKQVTWVTARRVVARVPDNVFGGEGYVVGQRECTPMSVSASGQRVRRVSIAVRTAAARIGPAGVLSSRAVDPSPETEHASLFTGYAWRYDFGARDAEDPGRRGLAHARLRHQGVDRVGPPLGTDRRSSVVSCAAGSAQNLLYAPTGNGEPLADFGHGLAGAVQGLDFVVPAGIFHSVKGTTDTGLCPPAHSRIGVS